jgi:hypothetical protein
MQIAMAEPLLRRFKDFVSFIICRCYRAKRKCKHILKCNNFGNLHSVREAMSNDKA